MSETGRIIAFDWTLREPASFFGSSRLASHLGDNSSDGVSRRAKNYATHSGLVR